MAQYTNLKIKKNKVCENQTNNENKFKQVSKNQQQSAPNKAGELLICIPVC